MLAPDPEILETDAAPADGEAVEDAWTYLDVTDALAEAVVCLSLDPTEVWLVD